MTEYLGLDDVYRVVERFGFDVRDAGLLSSALARPSSSMYGVDAYVSIDEKAAALLESLSRNHALVDGNRRTAWTATVLFLWINGFEHYFTADEAFELVVGVASGSTDLASSAARLSVLRLPRMSPPQTSLKR
ncbi:type II toxin-antitoxin system death-on-curing family toxin [Subtercola frigoramans]|uniref:Death-on-curing protein n=1 Tax=Subtercola frigoramans TaxID=120298 RepID=A0ABS2L406_9MICO|nr:type II toxin-antitoxin system death-on-curing family toxin [Subtercola frigoramans]MBM7471833.1 death-on-curing protein [Subtercola frigoramans]